jgi:ribosomal protein L23
MWKCCGTISRNVLDTMSDLVGKVDMKAKKPRITQAINKMEERWKCENANNEEGRKNYRRLRNEMKTATDKAKNEYLDSIQDKIMEFQSTGRNDLMYMKAKELG